MSNTSGLAKTSKETISAPTMYREIEQEENVARGCVEVIEIIAYDATKKARRRIPEKDGLAGEIMKDKDGKTLYVENGRAPYFCQDTEQAMTFSENNPGVRTETFTVQLRKRTAIKYLDDPRNMKQFKEAN
jgi:hypothetical protein